MVPFSWAEHVPGAVTCATDMMDAQSWFCSNESRSEDDRMGVSSMLE